MELIEYEYDLETGAEVFVYRREDGVTFTLDAPIVPRRKCPQRDAPSPRARRLAQ